VAAGYPPSLRYGAEAESETCMQTTSDQCQVASDGLEPLPELEEIPCVRNFDVWARLKKSSKYYYQGLEDPTNSKSKPRFFQLECFHPSTFGTKLCRDGYLLRFNNNQYRIEDVELFLVDPKNTKHFLRIL
jgi:hypothetical protein